VWLYPWGTAMSLYYQDGLGSSSSTSYLGHFKVIILSTTIYASKAAITISNVRFYLYSTLGILTFAFLKVMDQ